MSDKRTPDRVVISKDFDFEAAHHLPFHDGKCKRPHGHSYKLRVSLIGDVAPDHAANPQSGMVVDFGDLKAVVKPIVDEYLDHHNLNDYLLNPTAEHILLWIVGLLRGRISPEMLYEVTLWETATCSATWRKHLHG